MGNINKRGGHRNSIPSRGKNAVPKENLQLAPVEIIECESRDAECPICFLNFSALNSVTCCKQSICTECYNQLKAKGDTTCPFCGRASMQAYYAGDSSKPVSTKTSVSDDHNSNENTSQNGNTPCTPVSTQSSARWSEGSGSASSVGVLVHTASKSDRDALEEEIRNQRLQFAEDLPPSPPQRAPTGRHSTHSGLRHRSGGAYNSRRRFTSPPAINSTNDQAETNEGADDELRRELQHRNERFLSSLQTLLDVSALDQVSSLDQLEEIMLMEAIRQSMLDTQPPGPPRPATPSSSLPAPTTSDNVPTPVAAPSTPLTSTNDDRSQAASPDVEARASRTLLEQIEFALSTPPLSPDQFLSVGLEHEGQEEDL